MDFGIALQYLKQGYKVKRKNWGGYWFIPQVTVYVYDAGEHPMNRQIVACLKDDAGYVPATAYQEDMLAEDWEVIQ